MNDMAAFIFGPELQAEARTEVSLSLSLREGSVLWIWVNFCGSELLRKEVVCVSDSENGEVGLEELERGTITINFIHVV